MLFVTALVAFTLAQTAEGRVGNSSKIDFCTETEECLMFDLICKNSEYEVRHYSPAKWVCTSLSTIAFEIFAPRAFSRLFKYISGENDQDKKVEMTSPVLVHIPENVMGSRMFKMCFLLPSKHQENPPKPKSEEVQVTETPDMKVYVHSYGGWMTTVSDYWKARNLASALDSAKAKYTKGHHCAAGYNSPMTLFNRHNEVWYQVEGEPVCGSNE